MSIVIKPQKFEPIKLNDFTAELKVSSINVKWDYRFTKLGFTKMCMAWCHKQLHTFSENVIFETISETQFWPVSVHENVIATMYNC